MRLSWPRAIAERSRLVYYYWYSGTVVLAVPTYLPCWCRFYFHLHTACYAAAG